jgi:prepilin-type processing-associated H-X9-DG protein
MLNWGARAERATGNNLFICPNADPGLQFDFGSSSGAYAGYGLSPWGTSTMFNTYISSTGPQPEMPNPTDTRKPLIRRMSQLMPNKLFGADGGYNMAVYSYTSQPGGGQFQYWVYRRHFGIDTKGTNDQRYKGTANYLFSDGHVEASNEDRLYNLVPSKLPAAQLDRSPWYQPF